MPKVSFIVPVYNAEKAIERCANSILKQEFQDLELILVDDGSKDNSPAILDRLAEEDSRVKVIHQPNGGVSKARNNGIAAASGTYLQFADADDWVSPDSSKLMVRTMEENGCDMVVGDFYRVWEDNVAIKGSIDTDEPMTVQEYAKHLLEDPASYYYGVIWNKIYRRSLIEEYDVKMDEDVSYSEDFLFNLEYLKHCKTVCALHVPVYYYVKTEGSLVDQNMNISSIMDMKTTVYQYYDEFFREIFDAQEYASLRPEIARFMLAAASDNFALPMMPGTKKLGEEMPQIINFSGNSNILTINYYQEKLYERYLNAIALKYDLTLADVRVFDAIRNSGQEKCTQAMISDITDLSQMTVLNSIYKLDSRGFISINIKPTSLDASLNRENSDKLLHDLNMAMEDLMSVCFAGFSDSERELAVDLFNRIRINVRKVLGQDIKDE